MYAWKQEHELCSVAVVSIFGKCMKEFTTLNTKHINKYAYMYIFICNYINMYAHGGMLQLLTFKLC